jgi:beta-lactamase class A
VLLVAFGATVWTIVHVGAPPTLTVAADSAVDPGAEPMYPTEPVTMDPTSTQAPVTPSATPSPSASPSPTVISTATAPRPTAVPPTPVQVARASRFAPVDFRPDANLGARVAQRLAGLSGRHGVAIKDLNTGLGVLIDPDGEYEAASLFKLSVMYEVFKQRDQGLLSLSESLTLTDRHVAYDLGTLDRPAGSTIELREALERMITISDNSSAILLTDRVGAFNINRDLQALGLSHTHVLVDDLSTSPGDMLAFFEMLARGQGVAPDTSAEMVHLLARQRVNDRIPWLLPSGTTVAHKTGNLPGVVNDAGIVYAPDAAFVIAVLVDGTSNETEAARLIADLAAMAYESFRSAPAASREVLLPTLAPTATLPPATPVPTATPRPPTLEPTATPISSPSVPATVAPPSPSPTAPATATRSATLEATSTATPPTGTSAPASPPAPAALLRP